MVKALRGVIDGELIREVEIDITPDTPLYWMEEQGEDFSPWMAANIFCPTGPGGGVDPSCGKAEGGSSRQGSDSPEKAGFTIEAFHGSKLSGFDMKYHAAGRGGYRYWTASEDHASGYAGEKGTLIKGNLRINNPIDLMNESGPADGLKYRLRDAGYDAIIISEKGGDKSYFIFEDDQIYRKKSPATVNTFNPDQKRDSDGKWTAVETGGTTSDTPNLSQEQKRVFAKMVDRLKAIGGSLKHSEHVAMEYVKSRIDQNLARLPDPIEGMVRDAFAVGKMGTQAAFVTWTVSQALAEKIAKERGLSDDQAKTLRGALTAADIATAKPLLVGAEMSHVGAAALIASSFIPPATAGYLAYSLARHPLATIRAAIRLVKERPTPKPTIAKKAPTVKLQLEELIRNDSVADLRMRVVDALQSHGYSDWYFALLSAALGETKEVGDAIRAADRAFALRPVDDSEPQDDDTDAVVYRPVNNVFYPTGAGGGVDPSCKRSDKADTLPNVREELLQHGLGLGALSGTGVWERAVIDHGGDKDSIQQMTRLFDLHKWGGDSQTLADKEIYEQFNSDTPLGKSLRAQSAVEEEILRIWDEVKDERLSNLRKKSRKDMRELWEDLRAGNNDAYGSWEEQWDVEEAHEYRPKPLLFYRKGDSDKGVIATTTKASGAQSHAVIGSQSQQPHFVPNKAWTAEQLHDMGYRILGGFGYLNLGYSGESEVTWVKDDSHGKSVTNEWVPTSNTRWKFSSDSQQLDAFKAWLNAQIGQLLTSKTEEELMAKYAEEGYKKGAGRAFDDAKKSDKLKAQLNDQLDFYQGSRDQFLKQAFGQPVATERVKVLASRSFEDLDGVTKQMAVQMRRVLTDGLTQGKSPFEVAKDLTDVIDEIGERRAKMIARTETIRAHAEGQLDTLEKLGVGEVGVAVEWSTSGLGKTKRGYPSPCAACAPLQGIVLKISEARGMIPRHPNCMCSFTPAGVGEDSPNSKTTQRQIQKAIDKSLKQKDDGWGPAEEISKKRPESILNRWIPVQNVFCPTGPGGGVDPFNPDQARGDDGKWVVVESGGTPVSNSDPRVKEIADRWFRPDGSPRTRSMHSQRVREESKRYGISIEESESLVTQADSFYKETYLTNSDNCGTGAGGFKEGNTCGAGKGSTPGHRPNQEAWRIGLRSRRLEASGCRDYVEDSRTRSEGHGDR